jgi:hypothetical protein
MSQTWSSSRSIIFFAADGVDNAHGLEAADDEGLEEDEGHLFGQAALVHVEGGADDDDGAAGVVDALAEEVLAEAALLALEHVGEGFQRAVGGAGDGTAVAAVVEEGVDGFLEHALFVADDDVRGLELQQVLQAVVAVDDAAVEVVEVAGSEAAALQGDEGAEVRRDDGEDRQDHPFRPGVAGAEGVEDLHPLGEFLAGLLGAGLFEFAFEALELFFEIHLGEDVADAFGAHLGDEGLAVLVEHFVVFFLGEGLAFAEGGVTGVDHDVLLVVQHAFQFLGRHVQHGGHAARGALEEPEVRNRHGQFDVAHALAADASQRHFDAAAVADDILVLDALVLAAGAFPVLGRAEDALAEQAALFGLEGPVVDGLRVLHLSVAPLPDGFRGGQGDGDGIEPRAGVQTEDRGGHDAGISSFHRDSPHSKAIHMIGDGARAPPYSTSWCCTRMSRARLWISFMSTLNDSGMPASRVLVPLTMDS